MRDIGQVEKVVGIVIESRGPAVGVGDLCEIRVSRNAEPVLAEVVGFRGDRVQLMSFAPLHGMAQRAEVTALHRPLTVPVGEALLGRILNAFGLPRDGREPIATREARPIGTGPPDPLAKLRITEPLSTGVRAIDAFLTCGRGQRLGIFSGSGVGKSTLLGMVGRNTAADVNVIALIGERGREVREFIEKDLGDDCLKKSVVVIASSDQPPLVRVKAAQTALTLAEYFRDSGKDVMLLLDSVTRVAMALREIGLAIGEPPTSRGYTPSVFAFLPPLLERAGTGAVGSITGFFTVLVEGDDVNDPISDATRAILDGHIVLSRELAARNHYPAIDVLASISRVMDGIADDAHRQAAATLRALLSTYVQYEDLVTVGAYRAGQNRELDRALHFLPRLREVLCQEITERADLAAAREAITRLAREVTAWSGEKEAVTRA